jgi:hypothetical protein
VQTFIDSAFKLVDAQKIWKEFSGEIPFECYINGGPTVICKVVTQKGRKRFIKERRNYRQQRFGVSGGGRTTFPHRTPG